MPISKAYQLCPQAIFLPPNHEFYEKVSQNIMNIVKKYSPKWEIVSLDEAYLDLTQTIVKRQPGQLFDDSFEEAEKLAKNLKNEIFKKEKLTSTVGIGPNKLIAKIASQKAKPNGLLVIKPDNLQKFLDPLDIEEIPGIGPKTSAVLRSLGVEKIKDLRELEETKLRELFGKIGEEIAKKAKGIDEEKVSPVELVKSFGKEHTFEKDTRDPEIIFSTLEKIIKEVWEEIVNENFIISGISIRCRFKGFETKSRQKSFKGKLKLENFEKLAKKLLLELLLKNGKPVRLIGVRVKIAK
jgi:DNA polymerase IV (DinB-like DNA polymerase)